MTSFFTGSVQRHDLTSWKIPPPRHSDILLLCSDDNIKHCGWKKFQSRLCLHSFAGWLPEETCVWFHWSAVLIMWQDVAVNGGPGITSSALESFELPPLSKFKAFFLFFKWICLLWNSISFKSFLSCVNVGNFNLRWQCVLWYLRKNRTTASTILCIRKLCACSWL